MYNLKTWAGRSSFKYTGSVRDGTEIIYGSGFRVKLSTQNYINLIPHFSKNTVDIGTSHDAAPKDSLGEWLQKNVTKTAIASYVGPILIREGYAEKVGRSQIKFK